MKHDLTALREAVAQMTEGPWKSVGIHISPIMETGDWTPCELKTYEDAAGIVALRDAAPALLDEVERLQSLWDAEHATVMRLLSERDAAREQRDTFAVEMKDEACAAVDKVTASACDKIDALNQRHAEIVSVVADISKAYAADKKRHAEAVERAFRTGYRVCVEDREAPDIVHGSEDAAWIVSEAKARLL